MPVFSSINMFICGDVMTGRGIDQVLPHPSDPTLHESYVKDAGKYVRLAEDANGDIPKPVSFSYIWGDALEEFKNVAPDLRLINLETSVTRSDDYWKGKEIHYRMNPANIACLTAANIDYCSLANNHVLDWGYSGLKETLETLRRADVKASGAGENIDQAELPAIMDVECKGRVLVYSYASLTSGVPYDWAASKTKPGVNLLEKSSFQTMKNRIAAAKRKNDIVVFSIHWGHNWGYEVPFEQRDLAHRLIDDAGVDLVWGAFFASRKRNRSLPWEAYPLWLRGFPERLRRHRRLRGVQGRSGVDVLCQHRSGYWKACFSRDGADAG